MEALSPTTETTPRTTSDTTQEALPGIGLEAAASAEIAEGDATSAAATEATSEREGEGEEASAEASGEGHDPNQPLDRRRIEEQLEALKRKESELRRALAIADHPELADAIRVIEGRAYAVSRVEAKMAQGLSKSEERRCETLDKKLSGLRAKRAELDAQIAELETELFTLTEERKRAVELERREALERLLAALGEHEGSLRKVGLDAVSLIPDLARWMPEVQAMAEALVAASPRHGN